MICDMCRLTWQELGITKVEWTAHRMQKALNARRLDVQAKLNALAPLGASPRILTVIGPGELCSVDVVSHCDLSRTVHVTAVPHAIQACERLRPATSRESERDSTAA